MQRLRGLLVAILVVLAESGRETPVVALSCGDGVLDVGEDCDPPASVACPPGSPAGAYLACNDDCTWPPTPTTTTTLPSCPPTPRTGCVRSPTHGALVLLDERSKTLPLRKRLVWSWRKGSLTSKVESFGNPVDATSYQLCLYDDVDGAPHLKLTANVPAGGLCAEVPCWKRISTGFRYRDKGLTADGLSQILLTGADLARGRIVVKGTGPMLPLPDLPLSQDGAVTLQLGTSDGMCWEALYGSSARNHDGQFKATSD